MPKASSCAEGVRTPAISPPTTISTSCRVITTTPKLPLFEISGKFFPYTIKIPAHAAMKFGANSDFTSYHYMRQISKAEALDYQDQIANDSIGGCNLEELFQDGVPIASVRVSCNDLKEEYFLHYFGDVYDISGRVVENDYDLPMWLGIEGGGLVLSPAEDGVEVVGAVSP